MPGNPDLTIVPSTNLYVPVHIAPGENMLFLRWDAVNPPPTLLFTDVWSDSGQPSQPGYFVFLNATPAGSDAPALASLLMKNLPAPSMTGFVWAVFSPAPPPPTIQIQTTISMKLDAANRPSVDGDTVFHTPPGSPALGFSDGASAASKRSSGNIAGVSITYPPSPSVSAPTGRGVFAPITGALTGCVTFQALINALGPSGSAVKKALVDVAIDPLHPVDPKRNYTVFTGEEFWLTPEGATFRLTRAT